MIQEIINFVDNLPQEVFTYNLQPKEGLYILVDIDEQGNLVNADKEGKIHEKDIGFFNFIKKGNKIIGEIIENEVLMNNIVDYIFETETVMYEKSYNPSLKFFAIIASPFGLGFKVDAFKKADEEKKTKALNNYFKGAKKHVNNENADHIKFKASFEQFCQKNLFKVVEKLLELYDKKLKKNHHIFFFDKAPSIENHKEIRKEYLRESVFIKQANDKSNKKIKDVIFGPSIALNSGNWSKKPFRISRTAVFDMDYRVNGDEGATLWRFSKLLNQKALPNPFPIFIHKEEILNKTTVKLFQSDKKGLSFPKIMESLFHNYKDDIKNYYLFQYRYIPKLKEYKVVDVDFVSNFRYEMKDVKIVEVFSLSGDLVAKTKIKNVFDFEYKIVNRFFFNHQLMPKENWRRYFDEMDAHKMSANTYNQLMKYRKAFYNYVFKSRRQAVTKMMFDDIMLKGILEDIRLDNNGNNDYSIKAKLNIWFSLYEYFDYTQFNKPLNSKSMVNKTEELINRISIVATNEEEHLKNDDEFAFAAGQIIHFLLNKSEAGNRTHALLEPFLQKTDGILLKREIARCFSTYKHAIKFYARKYEFDKIMSEVMGYEPDEKNMKNLLPSTLAGYFAKSTFSKKSEN